MRSFFHMLDVIIIQFSSGFVIFVKRPMNTIKPRVFRIYISGWNESCGVDRHVPVQYYDSWSTGHSHPGKKSNHQW